jgi:hypothetical protein
MGFEELLAEFQVEVRCAYPGDYIAPGIVLAYLGDSGAARRRGEVEDAWYASVCRYDDYDGKNVVTSARGQTMLAAVRTLYEMVDDATKVARASLKVPWRSGERHNGGHGGSGDD